MLGTQIPSRYHKYSGLDGLDRHKSDVIPGSCGRQIQRNTERQKNITSAPMLYVEYGRQGEGRVAGH